MVISGSTGCIREWNMGGQPLLTEGVTPCFFRACIDNDRGGTGGRSYASRYKSSACRLFFLVGQRGGVVGGGSARYAFHALLACFMACCSFHCPPFASRSSRVCPHRHSLIGWCMRPTNLHTGMPGCMLVLSTLTCWLSCVIAAVSPPSFIPSIPLLINMHSKGGNLLLLQ